MTRLLLPILYRVLSWSIFGVVRGRKIKVKKRIYSFNADPFFICDENGDFLLYEEKFIWSNGRIRVQNLETRKSIVLKEPFHLSFPFVFKYKGAWLMLPESSENGDLRIYGLDTGEFKIDFQFNILCGVSYVDAVVINIDEEKETLHILLNELGTPGLVYIEVCMVQKMITRKEDVDTNGYSYERNAGLIVKNNRKYLVEQRRGNKGYGHYRVVHDIEFRKGKYTLTKRGLMLNTHTRNHHYYEIDGSYVQDGMRY